VRHRTDNVILGDSGDLQELAAAAAEAPEARHALS
jgi:hypothetical protein